MARKIGGKSERHGGKPNGKRPRKQAFPVDDASERKRAKAESEFEKATAPAHEPDFDAPVQLRDVTAAQTQEESRLPPDDKIKATLAHLVGLKAKVDEHHGRYREAVKKAEEIGIPKFAIKAGMKALAGAIDGPEIAQENRIMQRVYGACGVEFQLSLFGQDAAVGDKALADGYRAGLKALNSTDNPHGLNTQAGQMWMKGWHLGQSENAAGIKNYVAPATPEPKPEDEDAHDDSDGEEVTDADDAEDGDAPLPQAAAGDDGEMPKFLRRPQPLNA